MTTKYPNGIDTDAEIPRVDDNITEIGGEAINSLRAAVFALEKALGIKPQGTAVDLAARLAVSLDNNGGIKASALTGIGLVALPITNAQVGSTAGIAESKLALQYSTTQLKAWINSLQVRVDALEAAVAADIANLSQHVAHPATWGRHMADDVDAYNAFVGLTVQGALDNLDTRLDAHIADPVDAHDGSAISLDASRFSSITAADVQSAAEQLEDLQLVEIVRHRDRQHSNGILGTQDVFVSGTRHGVTIIATSTTTAGSAGDTFIKFAVAPDPTAFQSIAKNDRIDFTVGGRTYSFTVEGTQSSNQVNIFGQLPVSGAGVAAVYRNAEETSEPSAAMVCLRKDDLVGRPSTLQLVQPSAPYILSSGLRSSQLSATYKYLRLLYRNGDTGDMDIYAAMTAFSANQSTWTVENMAKVLNASILSPGIGSTGHPLVAFAYKGELGFACDTPDADGYVTVGVATAPLNDAAWALGFTYGATGYAMSPRDLYIDGYEIPSVRLLLDAYGQITAGDTITFPASSPLALGVKTGMLAHVSLYETGTYVISSATPTAILFDSVNEHDFSTSINKWVRVRVWMDAFSLSAAPAQRTLYEVFLDGYNDGYGPVAGFRASPRVTYADTAGGGAGLESIMDLTAVSRTFGAASRRVFYDYSRRTVVLGTPVTGPSITSLGLPVSLPSSNEPGFRFALYDANGVDYCEFELANTLPGSDGYMDVTVSPRISEERFLQVATVLHNRTRFRHLDDTRQFGNVGRQDVRDDFTRDYISYPRSLLRGNGIIYGFTASGLATRYLQVAGGQALVNGQLKSIGKASFLIPSDGAATYNLFVDSDGVLNLLRDNYFSSNILSTPSIAELLSGRTETVLAQVVVDGFNFVNSIADMRRFVNDIDSKLDLLVEENDITHGSFASLAAATAYLNALPSGSPASRRIRVRGELFLSDSVVLPDHVALEGDGYGASAKITYLSSSATIVLGQGNTVRDLAFYRSGSLSPGFLSGTTISDATIEGCGFEFAAQLSGNFAITCGYLNRTKIDSCRFAKVDVGLWSDKGSYGSRIVDSIFSGVGLNALLFQSPSGYTATDLIIEGNAFDTGSFLNTAGAALVRLVNPWGAVIRSNIFTTSASSAAARQMLHIEGTSFACRIESNGFGNSGSGTGFQRAIWFDGTVGAPMHTADKIIGNTFMNFNGGSAKTVLLNNANGTVVTDNAAFYCRTPLEITEGNWITIERNNFPAMNDAPVLNILSPTVGEHFIVADNFFANADVINERVVVLQTATGVGGIFHGNTVRFNALAAFYGKALVYVDGAEWSITSNEIGCFSIGGFLISESPLMLTANASKCLVTLNNLWHAITVFIPKISVNASAANVIETMNKGMTYTVTLPPFHVISNPSDWTQDGYGMVRDSSSAYHDAGLFFSNDVIPIGAQLVSATIGFYFTGSANDLRLGWLKAPALNRTTFTKVSLSARPVPPQTPGTQTLTPITTTYMEANVVHFLYIEAGMVPAVHDVAIYGATITYIL